MEGRGWGAAPGPWPGGSCSAWGPPSWGLGPELPPLQASQLPPQSRVSPLPAQGSLPLSTSSELRPAGRLQETRCLKEAPGGEGGLGAGTPRSPRGSQAEPGPAQQPGCEGIFRGEINSLVVQRPGSEPGCRDEAGRAERAPRVCRPRAEMRGALTLGVCGARGLLGGLGPGSGWEGRLEWAESRGRDTRIRPCQCAYVHVDSQTCRRAR